MLVRVKRLLLAVLTMLAPAEGAARGCGPLRCRFALLTRPARSGGLVAVGTKGVPVDFGCASGGPNKGRLMEARKIQEGLCPIHFCPSRASFLAFSGGRSSSV